MALDGEPQAFLMDERLSNLDAELRVSIRASLYQLHERLGATTVYVTHDQIEAMTLGHRVAVLRDGLLQQVDTPQYLYEAPVNLSWPGSSARPYDSARGSVRGHTKRRHPHRHATGAEAPDKQRDPRGRRLLP